MKRYVGIGNIESMGNAQRIARVKQEQGQIQVVDNMALGLSPSYGFVINGDEAALYGSEYATIQQIDRHLAMIIDSY